MHMFLVVCNKFKVIVNYFKISCRILLDGVVVPSN